MAHLTAMLRNPTADALALLSHVHTLEDASPLTPSERPLLCAARTLVRRCVRSDHAPTPARLRQTLVSVYRLRWQFERLSDRRLCACGDPLALETTLVRLETDALASSLDPHPHRSTVAGLAHRARLLAASASPLHLPLEVWWAFVRLARRATALERTLASPAVIIDPNAAVPTLEALQDALREIPGSWAHAAPVASLRADAHACRAWLSPRPARSARQEALQARREALLELLLRP